ncbi:putative quinol monooxygenase [Roseomonas sp. BN140053]|uniref:putative quinol monooxygenase n=1 Tax=Roseomonas sp. BN140053 TaxID=3391898 RepID=UPI0039EAE665
MEIVVLGHARLQPWGDAAFRGILDEFLPLVRLQPGCQAFDVFFGGEDPRDVAIIERWTDEDALAANLAAPHTTLFLDLIAPWIEGADTPERARAA